MTMSPFSLFVAVGLTLACILGVIVMIEMSWIVHSTVTTGKWEPSSKCPAGTCKSGLAFVKQGTVEGCTTINDLPGTTCSDECHATGASLTCNAEQECTSTDPTTCRGYCLIDDPVSNYAYEQNSAECQDKLVFRNYHMWNTSTSSEYHMEWLYYSDYPPECTAHLGCTWYSWRAKAFYDEGFPEDLTIPNIGVAQCLEFLNMTNMGCITAYPISIESALSTPVWREIPAIIDNFNNISEVHFITEMCVYSYTCFTRNESFFSDPDFLRGETKKRAVTPPTMKAMLAERALQVLQERAASPHHPHFAAHADYVKKRRAQRTKTG